MKALKIAFRDHKAPKIHHSDRGNQYTYSVYIDLLKRKGCKISMANTARRTMLMQSVLTEA